MEIVKKLILKFLVILLLISCNNKKEDIIENYTISIGTYGILNSKQKLTSKETMKVKKIEFKGDETFIYDCQKLHEGLDSLKILANGKVYFNNAILMKVDSKAFKNGNSMIIIDKYSDIKNLNIQTVSDFYLNREKGLIARNVLSSYHVIAYDTENLNFIHKKIMSDSLHFKISPRY